jgi:hypothetical protein
MASSTLLPKIHRYSMLPIRCIQPPCRNIEVTTESSAGIAASPGASSRSPNSTAGIMP